MGDVGSRSGAAPSEPFQSAAAKLTAEWVEWEVRRWDGHRTWDDAAWDAGS